MKFVVTRGLPACGKTTYARAWVAEDPTGRARVNRDDLRAMAHDGVFVKGGTEQAILAARDAAISALLRKGLDVVCDDTNLPSRTVRDLANLARKAGAQFEVLDLTDVPIQTCVERDKARERSVGEAVIRDLHLRYVHGRPHPLPMPSEPEAADLRPYIPPEGRPEVMLVDVDGTIALMNGRSPYDESRVHEDRPNLPVIRAVRALAVRYRYRVILCSGRTEACREATERWLAERVRLHHVALFMRQVGDTRKDAVVKAELFDQHIRDNYQVMCVFDDRSQVVEMWRGLGLTVFQVAAGDF